MKDLNLFRAKDSVYLREVSNKVEVLEDLDCDGFLIRASENVARSIIASLKDKKEDKVIAFIGGDDVFNRRAIESLGINYLVSSEASGRDSVKQRDSGLNHVVARIAKEKGIVIIVDMGEISKLKGREKAKRIARVMQNVRVCRKVGCFVGIASLGLNKKEVFNKKGRVSFGISLGMSSKQSAEAIRF